MPEREETALSLSIRALGTGTIVGLRKPTITHNRGWGMTHDSPVLMFVIDGADTPVIVDTGPPDPDRVWRYHRYRFEQKSDEEPSLVLSRAGVDPASVRTVINTHLHWDHCSNNHLFPNARFLVQNAELEYAANPVQWHCASFEHLPGVEAPWEKVRDRLELVEGDADILPGVSLVALPGHTPGSQGVLVDTAKGRYLIAGDCVDTYENWEGDDEVTHFPSGYITNIIDYEASFKKIESLECEVIPSHDIRVLEVGHFG